MEQKKILWIVVAISVFVLIIFGTALILYAPTRSSAASQQAAVTPVNTIRSGDGSQQNIDPDSWVRDPGKTPGLDTSLPPAPINLTIVNGDNTGAKYGTMDVSGLTQGSEVASGTLQTPPEGIPGQEPLTTTNKTNETLSDKKAGTAVTTAETTKVTTTTVTTEKKVKTSVASAPKAKQTTAKNESRKVVAAKPISVTEYWIQTGSFSNKINAEKARESLTARYLNAEIFTKDVAGKTSFRVRVGPYKTKTEAEYWLGTVKEMKDFAGSYVSEVKSKK
jgi:cell division septation protein DedD